MKPTNLLGVSLGLVFTVACSGPSVSSDGENGGGPNGSAGRSGTGTSGSGSGAGGLAIPQGAGTPTGGAAGSGGPTEQMNCGLTKVALESRPADLLLVLDRSGSMVQEIDVGGTQVQKWPEVVSALDTVVKKTEGAVSWGLKLYPVPNQCSVPDGATVPVAANNHGAVMAAINANTPVENGGSTPTRVAVEKGVAFMRASGSPNSKYLVVATDGLPNCRNGGGGGQSNRDPAGAVAAVTAAAAAGMPSFVVGIATQDGDAHDTLNQMAVAGGRPRNGDVRYYPVASRDELTTALETITGQIVSCTFFLDKPPPSPNDVAVNVDGMRVARDTNSMEGWNYGDGNRSVVLYGSVCDKLKAGDAKDVQIIFGCPGMPIP